MHHGLPCLLVGPVVRRAGGDRQRASVHRRHARYGEAGTARDHGRPRRGMALPHDLQPRRGLPARHQDHEGDPRGDPGDRQGGDRLRLLIHTDGAARGNPGPAGAGAILRDADDGTVLAEIAEPLGHATNNVAEWSAVRLALEEALRLGATHVDLRMDSELVARQISGIYRVKHPDLKPIHTAVMDMLRQLDGYTVGHVPRALNKDAD